MTRLKRYRRLLPLRAPWAVAKVDERTEERRIDLTVEHSHAEPWPCPKCSVELPLYDHSEQREWRHVDAGELATYVHARAPRVECSKHGVRQVRLPWAEPRMRFTIPFERRAIDVLREADTLGATRVLRISWDQAYQIMRRAVERGLHTKGGRPITHFAIRAEITTKGDELYSVWAEKRGVVLYVAFDLQALGGYFKELSKKQSEPIDVISMDLDERLIRSLRLRPSTRDVIAIASSHIMRRMDEAITLLRSELMKQGVDNDTLRVKMDRAHQYKKNLRAWLREDGLRSAARLQKHWHVQATHSQLAPITKLAGLINRNLRFVLNLWRLDVVGATPQLERRIQDVKRSARGFRNPKHLATALYFHCGDLQLYPARPELTSKRTSREP